MSGEVLISLALIIPLVGMVAIWLLGKSPDVRECATLLTAIALFGVCATLAARVGAGESPEWVMATAAPGLDFAFKLEPLGALFACIASGLWSINSLYSIGYMRGNKEGHQTRFYMCFAIALFGAMGVAMAANLFTLFVFYEVLTISTYPLVAHKGDDNARRGGRIYLTTLLGTSVGLLLLAIVGTYMAAGSTDFVEGGLLDGQVTPLAASVLLILFMFGIGKAALMPFHFWLPNAMVAPTPVSALLHAVAVVKAGVFTVLKVAIYIFGPDLLDATPARDGLLMVAVGTIIIASLIAMTKDNLKARLAYSTVGQLAYVTTGALLATGASFAGGALQILMHAFGKITLFMCAGAIYVATGKTEISQMRGLGRRMPWVFIAFTIGALSVTGLPPLGGAWPKFLLMSGAFEADKAYAAWALLISSLLNIAYLLPIGVLALMPPKGPLEIAPYKRPGGTPPFAVGPLLFTALGSLVLFFFAGPVVDFLTPATGALR